MTFQEVEFMTPVSFDYLLERFDLQTRSSTRHPYSYFVVLDLETGKYITENDISLAITRKEGNKRAYCKFMGVPGALSQLKYFVVYERIKREEEYK